jgi:taurine dioxygenase
MTIEINPLSDALGAEVLGVDMRNPSDDEVDAIEKALNEYLMVVIRGQKLTPGEYANAARKFGDLAPQHMTELLMEGHPDICVLDSSKAALKPDGKPKLVGEGNWHVDHTNLERPPKYTVLYAEKLPSSGGDTGFANMQKAFASLPAEEQERLSKLKSANGLLNKPDYTSEEHMEQYGKPKIHPFIRTHPATGKKAIYCHPQKLAYIEGMSPEDSRALILDLQARTINKSTMYRHKWKPGDLVIWDNRGVMHKAFYDYDHTEGRIMHRILVEGEVPV